MKIESLVNNGGIMPPLFLWDMNVSVTNLEKRLYCLITVPCEYICNLYCMLVHETSVLNRML